MDSRGGEFKQPANIFGSYKMPGWAHHVSTQDRAIGECSRAIQDARAFLQEKLTDLEGEFYEPEEPSP